MMKTFLSRNMPVFVREEAYSDMERRKIMLNIFADALLLASGFGGLKDGNRRRDPHEFQDIEALRVIERQRNLAR